MEPLTAAVSIIGALASLTAGLVAYLWSQSAKRADKFEVWVGKHEERHLSEYKELRDTLEVIRTELVGMRGERGSGNS